MKLWAILIGALACWWLLQPKPHGCGPIPENGDRFTSGRLECLYEHGLKSPPYITTVLTKWP